MCLSLFLFLLVYLILLLLFQQLITGASTIVSQSKRQFWKPLLGLVGSSSRRTRQMRKSHSSCTLFSTWIMTTEQKIHLL
uniref:Putative ovule protein n=1 Tax=Solanum chacoense TaxID=4108 RepID=A0A0V0GH47_SOLCH